MVWENHRLASPVRPLWFLWFLHSCSLRLAPVQVNCVPLLPTLGGGYGVSDYVACLPLRPELLARNMDLRGEDKIHSQHRSDRTQLAHETIAWRNDNAGDIIAGSRFKLLVGMMPWSEFFRCANIETMVQWVRLLIGIIYPMYVFTLTIALLQRFWFKN